MRSKFYILTSGLLLLAAISLGAQDYKFEWRRAVMDNSRTGVTPASVNDVEQTLGKMEGTTYVAPNGKRFKDGSTPRVAAIMLSAQPSMAHLKEVIAQSAAEMSVEYPESALSNWFVDEVLRAVADSTGRQVDISIVNFGGIRTSMPKGNVLLDDIMSMFPFKNNLCYVALKGNDVRVILDQLAATRIQPMGGVRIEVKDGKIVSAEVGGKPLDDNKIYGVATISFLLNGGDGLNIARNAKELVILDGYIIDTILPFVKSYGAEGKLIEYKTDGRVKML